ncbi:hypothetical protein C5S53_01175, partial [Methanophagales archaeon]
PQKLINHAYDVKEVLFQLFPEATVFLTSFITRGTDIPPNLDAAQASFPVRVITIVVHLHAAFRTHRWLCSTKNSRCRVDEIG